MLLDNSLMKDFKEKKRAILKSEISKIEKNLLNFYDNLQLVSEEGLLDYYAYLIKAYEAKHKYLLSKIKEVTK